MIVWTGPQFARLIELGIAAPPDGEPIYWRPGTVPPVVARLRFLALVERLRRSEAA